MAPPHQALRLSAIASLAIAALAAPVRADDWTLQPGGTTTRGGYEVKFLTNDRYNGLLYGARGMRYLLPHLYAGIMAYGTLPAIGQEVAPAFGTMGLVAGWEGRLPHRINYDLNLNLGITRDVSDCSPSPLRNHFTMEPSVAVGMPVPYLAGTRLSIVAGYLILPFAFSASAPTIGLRWESKAFSRAVDD